MWIQTGHTRPKFHLISIFKCNCRTTYAEIRMISPIRDPFREHGGNFDVERSELHAVESFIPMQIGLAQPYVDWK
jgi:hypothetical protein